MLIASTYLRLLGIGLFIGGVAPSAGEVDPRTCKTGYVWRVATPNDLVCVTPEVRAQAQSDNRLAPVRRTGPPRFDASKCPLNNPRSNKCYAFDIPCKTGFVWRATAPDDYVCVTPATRAQAWNDNAQAEERKIGFQPTPPPRPTVPPLTISVTVPVSHQFEVTGSGFLPNHVVHIRVADAFANPNLFFNAQSDTMGKFTTRLPIPCGPGVLYFSANDERPVPSSADHTGTWWSDTVSINCQ